MEWKRLTLDLGDDLINVVEVVGLSVVGDRELSVGSKGSAITIWQVVDYDLNNVLVARGLLQGRSVGKVGTEVGNLRDSVEPNESRNVSHAEGLRLLSRIGDKCGCCLDLRSVNR